MPPTEIELIGQLIKIQENQSKIIDQILYAVKEITQILDILDTEVGRGV